MCSPLHVLNKKKVLDDSKTLLEYGIHKNSVIIHKPVRQRSYSDVNYDKLSAYYEAAQRAKRSA